MRRSILLAAILILVPGCLSPLDKEWHAVNTTFRQGNKAFAAVAKSYARCADDMAAKKHTLQEKHVERDLEDFLRIHTNADGRLVSVDAAGAEQPMRAEDFRAAIAARDMKLAQLQASRASWASVHEPFADTVAKFEAMTESTGETEAKIMDAKASAQALLDSALTAVGGIAAGVFSAAAVVP